MKIRLARSAGFCFGVKRAINIALKMAKTGEKVEMLGDIVHNEDVVKEINKAGIKKISCLKHGRGKTLLIRAHGASKNTIKKAVGLGYKIVDATCLMVKEIHKIAQQAEKQGYNVIIIGDKNHDEVKGITGQLKNRSIVIDALDKIPLGSMKKIEKAAVIVQSTQNIDKVLKILKILKPLVKDLKFFNTICGPTRLKQSEIKKMPLENGLMIIIGSKTSANTKRLYEISKSLNNNTRWIQSQKEIKKSWFKGIRSVGVTSGASTPDAVTRGVIDCIKKIT